MQLIAYVVHGTPSVSTAALRERLAVAPQLQIPSGFVYLPELPLTNSGKINRNALQAYDCALRRITRRR
jgi:acyl-coenzyme A synthetase/AMP-(fatty) acid ligase